MRSKTTPRQAKPPVEHQPNRRPTQAARSLTVEKPAAGTVTRQRRVRNAEPQDIQAAILRAAGEILDQNGYDGLSTTAIARRARISTATLYLQYPDKHAVLRALVRTLQSERVDAAECQYDDITTQGDWRAAMRESLMSAYRLRVQRPGGRSSRRALQTSPELWDWDQRQTEALAASLARAIRRRKPGMTATLATRVAFIAVSTSVALLDQASFDPRRASWILKEAIAMREAYLAPYLD